MELTPHCHEHCKQDRAIVIEQQAHLRAQRSRGEDTTNGTALSRPAGARARTLAYVQVSDSCHTLHPRSQSGHMTVSASHTSFLCDDNTGFLFYSFCKRAEGSGRSHERRAVEEGQAIKEDDDPDDSGRDEKIRVPAQPQVVQGHLLPKVVPDMRDRAKVTQRSHIYG